MQHLQWFPGHMTAAMRMMEENLKAVDGAIMILDARAAKASVNRKLDGLFRDKKILYVLNKSDLVEESDVRATLKELRESGKTAVSVCAMDKRAVDALYNGIFNLLQEKIERYRAKGIARPLRVMVVGIPNTGKSTIINALCGGKKTLTGNKAGVTRGKQWVRIKDLELLDTPGTMPPSFEDQTLAKHLAYIGSMNDANIDAAELAYEFIKEMKISHPQAIVEKYALESADASELEIMDAICVRRGFLLRGGEYDYERCGKAVIDDFRKGRLGKIKLD